MTNSIAAAVIKRDRMVVLVGLTSVITVSAFYTLNMAQTFVSGLEMIHPLPHNVHGFWMLFLMWAVMQVAMMSPTAVPMVLMHVKVERHRHPHQPPYMATSLFFIGYIIVWTVFSAVFAGVQLGLQSAALLSHQMASVTPWLAGGILIAAGLFQFSALKQACLNQCRSPVTYLMTEWRNGRMGALEMGLKHGVHCVGCCWILMALLFVAGVMNLLWMAVITALVLIEKLAVRGRLYGRMAGIGMILWGLGLFIGG